MGLRVNPALPVSLPRSPLTLDERRMRCGRRGKGGLKNQQCPRASKNMKRQLRDAQRHKMPGVIQRSRVASTPFRDICHNNGLKLHHKRNRIAHQTAALVTNVMKGHSTFQPDKAHIKSTDDNSGDRGRCIQSPSRLCLDQLWWVRNNALLSFLVCTYVLAHLTFQRRRPLAPWLASQRSSRAI